MNKIIRWPYISWSAIFSGVFTGFGINFLFNLCILALGISLFALNAANVTVLSYFGVSCYVLLSIITMFVTGWVAGRLTPPIFNRLWGALIGFIAWSVLLFITIIILTNMIQFTAFHSTFTSHPNMVAIRIANDSPFMTETKEKMPIQSSLDVNVEKVTKTITLNATATFLLFFLGASSSCIGGLLGYRRSKELNKLSQ